MATSDFYTKMDFDRKINNLFEEWIMNENPELSKDELIARIETGIEDRKIFVEQIKKILE